MKQYPTSTEVDFVVIGSGAGGGIMAKQLSVAGFSVVVLEQGGWGKYGREQEYNKDEWLNLQPERRRPLDERPVAPAQYVPPERQGQGRSRHPQLWLRGGRRHGHLRWQQLAPPAVRVQGSFLRSDDSVGHRHGGLADLLRGAGALLHAGRMGDGHIRPPRQFTVRRADVERLSGAARAPQEFGRAAQYRGG